MRTYSTICVASALAAAVAAEEPQRETLNFGVTVGDANVGASFTTGCYKMDQGKLSVVVCLDKKSSTALTAAAPKVAYAKVDGVFQNSARNPSCTFTWEGLDPALFNALKTTPPQISVGKKEMIAATEKAAFSLLLPLEQNEGVFPISGSTGMMTMCSLVATGMPAVTAPLAPEPVATTPVEEAASITPPAEVVDPVVKPEPAAATIDKQEVTSPGAALKASALMTVALGVVTMLLILV